MLNLIIKNTKDYNLFYNDVFIKIIPILFRKNKDYNLV